MKPILCLLLLCLCALGAVLRSPKDAANQPRRAKIALAPVPSLIPPAVVPRAITNRVPVKPITNVSLIWDWYPTSGPVSFNVWHTTNLRQWDLIKSNVQASPVKLAVQPGAHYFRVSSYRP